MIEWGFVPLGYVLGSVSSAIIVCRVMGLPDPREQGSRNPGATNVMRLGGKKAAAITLAGDMLKGLLPVATAHLAGVTELVLVMTMLAAFFGHLYPVFFGFQGGKGVATSLGVLLGVHVGLGLLVLTTWLAMFKWRKISSLSALTAAGLAPWYAWGLTGSWIILGGVCVMTLVLIWRHRGNIQRLWAGTEK